MIFAHFTTSEGNFTARLFDAEVPKTVANFTSLAEGTSEWTDPRTGRKTKEPYYNGTIFHRVIADFMIQGGDPSGNGTGGRSIYGEMFEDEITATSPLYKTGYKAGVIAMANRGPNTNGSQFFIMDSDYPLPPNYTIFGHVTDGQDVVNAIARVERDSSNDMPCERVTFDVSVAN